MKNDSVTFRMIARGLTLVSAMAATLGCSEGTPAVIEEVQVSDLRFLPEDFEGTCISHFISDQSQLEYLDALYTAHEGNRAQKLNFSVEHKDSRVFDLLSGGDDKQPGIHAPKNADRISIKIDDMVVKPLSVAIASEDRFNRVWSMEAYISVRDMPYGKFAQTRVLAILYDGKPFHEFRFPSEPDAQKSVNTCLESSRAEAAEYLAAERLQANGTPNAPSISSENAAGECTAVVIRPSLPVASDGTESEACFPGLKAGDPPVCATPVAMGSILYPSQIWLKDGARVSVCEHGGYCYPATSVRFAPACDDPGRVGYFEVE